MRLTPTPARPGPGPESTRFRAAPRSSRDRSRCAAGWGGSAHRQSQGTGRAAGCGGPAHSRRSEGKGRAAAIEVLRSSWDAYPITVAIANPGAENADAGNEPSSWAETSGDWESVASISGDFPINSPHGGSRFFYQQGAVAEAVLEQTVQLYNVPGNDIVAGNLMADLAAWQAHNYPDDQGQVIAEFLDADDVELGTVATSLQHVGTTGWVEVTASGAVPPGARQVRFGLRAVLVAGSVPNVALDDVALTIQEQAGGETGGQRVALVVVIP